MTPPPAPPPDAAEEPAGPPGGFTIFGRRFQPTFRMVVFGLIALLLSVGVMGGLLIQRAVVIQRIDDEIRDNHRQERDELARLAQGKDPDTGEPFHADDPTAVLETFLDRNLPGPGETFLAIVDGEPLRTPRGPVRIDQLPGMLERWSTGDSGSGRVETDAGPVQWTSFTFESDGEPTGAVFVIATFVDDLTGEVDDMLRTEAIVAALILLVTLALAWSLAGRLLRPIRAIRENAESLQESDLSARIPVGGSGDLADLARTYNAMLDRFQSAYENQRRFIDDAGHELRTPITIVQGHLELMGDDPDERRETLALVTDELDRMARMVEGLLALARAEQPNSIDPEPTRVDELTVGLFDRCLALGDRPWRIDRSARETVLVDGSRLTQAALNLARNAVEHTPAGTPIGIGSAVVDGHLHLWVRDEGAGVPVEEREHLFDRFSRGAAGRHRSEGAGLGLAIVKAIAEAHGGRATVECPVQGGSIFTISVPATVLDDADDLGGDAFDDGPAGATAPTPSVARPESDHPPTGVP